MLTLIIGTTGPFIWAVSSQGGWDVAWIVIPLLVIADGAALRIPFLRLTLGPDGVCAHNFVRNRSVAWADLSHVSINSTVNRPYVQGYQVPGKRYYWIELGTKSGRSVPVRGLTSYSEGVLQSYASRIVQVIAPACPIKIAAIGEKVERTQLFHRDQRS
jgi:hypothetical protein